MNNSDKATLDMLRKLIKEVKVDLKNKKILAESKTAEQVFNTHQKNIKEYVIEKVYKTLQESEG